MSHARITRHVGLGRPAIGTILRFRQRSRRAVSSAAMSPSVPAIKADNAGADGGGGGGMERCRGVRSDPDDLPREAIILIAS